MGAILSKALSLLFMILAGYGSKRLGVFSVNDAKVISRMILNLTLPAALINSFRTFDSSFLVLIVLAVISNLLLLGLGLLLTRGQDLSVQALYGLNLSSYNIGIFVLPFVQSFLSVEALLGVSMFDAGNCPINSGVSYAAVSALGMGERIRPSYVLAHPYMVYLIR